VLLIAAPILCTDLYSQREQKTTIWGRVTDGESGEPLEYVNIFLSYTAIGTSTDTNGKFMLTNVPAGIFDLVVSRMGYERQVISLRLLQPESLYYDIKLKSQLLREHEVEVIAESPEDWKVNLEQFVKAFIGKTGNAKGCRILNPEVLNFRVSEKADTLVASSDSIIRIENPSLGYRLSLVLASFVWNVERDVGRYLIYPRFGEMQPTSRDDLNEWHEKRKQCYTGSLKHFLRSLYHGITAEEMFRIYTGSLKKLAGGSGHRVNPEELGLAKQEGTPFKMLRFPGYLRVDYGSRGPDVVREEIGIDKQMRNIGSKDSPGPMSIITLNEAYALVDSSGNLLNPLSIEVAGEWARRRVAELVPLY